MTEGMSIEIARYKMQEKGVGTAYVLRYRHLFILPEEKRILKDRNDLFIIIEPDKNLRVSSQAGILDFLSQEINELQYVHTGIVTIENMDAERGIYAKLIQVIPNF